MIDFRALISEEKNLGKNPAAAYKADAFISIDNEISRIKDEDKMMDLREEARNLLEEDSGSIVLSYVAGRILLALRPHEYNMRLNNLLLSFYEAGNWDVVKYIGDLILSASESSKALRVLGDVADHQGEEEKKWDYYERLVKADSSDHDIIVIVADHFEKAGDRKSAMNYYQRALLRLQGTDEIQKMKDIFAKLIANGRSEYPFYSSFLESLSETNPETALELYRTLLSSLLSTNLPHHKLAMGHRTIVQKRLDRRLNERVVHRHQRQQQHHQILVRRRRLRQPQEQIHNKQFVMATILIIQLQQRVQIQLQPRHRRMLFEHAQKLTVLRHTAANQRQRHHELLADLAAAQNVPHLNQSMPEMNRHEACARIDEHEFGTRVEAHVVDHTANALEVILRVGV